MSSNAAARSQCASGVLLVRPAHFAYNDQTAASNRFQHGVAMSDLAARARDEFDRVRTAIEAAGVRVCVLEDTSEPAKPDAVFPNNWVSFHQDGTVVLYPMQAANRRAERRLDALETVALELGFHRRRLVDLRVREDCGQILEGTGSLVLDHVRRIAYACRSARTDEATVREWSGLMNFTPVLFDACGPDGVALYHTNVMLSIGSTWAVVCTPSIVAADRDRVLANLKSSGREIIEIGMAPMLRFGANILELARGVLIMSEQARSGLQSTGDGNWSRLRDCVEQVVAVAVPTLESVGGGSVRCMVAEVPETG
ncbi:MAG TPA: arginine deiminase-related protein [Steroidobacteraceae bacterium]